jgi:hypothetical protein
LCSIPIISVVLTCLPAHGQVTHHKRLLAAEAAGLDGGLDGSHNVLLSGYGAYGSCVASATAYSPEKLRLLREGWVVAHAHVRGGKPTAETLMVLLLTRMRR